MPATTSVRASSAVACTDPGGLQLGAPIVGGGLIAQWAREYHAAPCGRHRAAGTVRRGETLARSLVRMTMEWSGTIAPQRVDDVCMGYRVRVEPGRRGVLMRIQVRPSDVCGLPRPPRRTRLVV